MKYNLKGVGVDTTKLDYVPLKVKSTKENLKYILTNPSANNDFLLDEYIKFHSDDSVLLTEVNYVDGVDDVLQSHLKRLGKTSYKVLFMNGSLDYSLFDVSIENIKKLGIVENFGLSYPKDLDSLKKNVEYLNAIGCEIGSVMLNISPLYHQTDIIKYCEENAINIFATNPFGGWINARNCIASYSIPYILNFVSVYADVVLLSGRDTCLMEDDMAYLNSIIGQDVDDANYYSISSNVDSLIPSPSRTIKTALKIEGMVLPYNSPEYLFDSGEVKFSDRNILPEIKDGSETMTEMNIGELVDVVYRSPDMNDDDYFVALRYKVEDFLEISHPNWQKEIIKITDKIMYLRFTNIVTKKRWFGKLYEEIEGIDTYLVYYSDGIFKFKEIRKKVEK